MPFQLSPGVLVVEKDLSTVVPAVSASIGAFVGPFVWGPVEAPTTISSENQLVSRFGKPNSSNAAWWFTAANFLAYSNNLQVVRCGATGLLTANSGGSTVLVKNEDDFLINQNGLSGATAAGTWVAKYPGAFGNSIGVSVFDGAGATGFSSWTYASNFDSAPGTSDYAKSLQATGAKDEIHVIVYDSLGIWTGATGTILEKFAYVSKASDAVKSDGTRINYRDVINSNSNYIWATVNAPATSGSGSNWNTSLSGATSVSTVTFKYLPANFETKVLTNGNDGNAVTESNINNGLSLFNNTELYDISLIMTGPASYGSVNYAIQNVAENRKDCVVFASPGATSAGVAVTTPFTGTDSGDITAKTYDWRNNSLQTSSSYGVADSGWKYQYDRYNDVYRWVPLNGDTAGLCARTDNTNDPWWSPGGLNRGQIKNVVKLSLNPNKTDRDMLYKNGVNPIVSFPGQGVVLFGDKTLQARPSAFDRINVRRLFIVLEKAIAIAAKYQLFEFNDDFTRARFKGIVEPFLRDVQGRRGIIDFRVKCDETNNTGEVIDRNEFIADIYIKPARSINFITLNFIATRTGISFDEIGA